MDRVFARSENFPLKNSPVFEVVESADGVDEPIDHDLVITAPKGGIDSVAWVEFTQWFENGVVMAEEFDKGTG